MVAMHAKHVVSDRRPFSLMTAAKGMAGQKLMRKICAACGGKIDREQMGFWHLDLSLC